MKKISIVVPCFNEQDNLHNCYTKVTDIMQSLSGYTYEIIFADNNSTDQSQNIIRSFVEKDKHVKAIFNERNFGYFRSERNAFLAATGDAIITLSCDLQEPPELIPTFIKEWRDGAKGAPFVIWGQKTKSHENPIKYILRSIYYKIIKSLSDVPQYEHTMGFGLIDKRVQAIIRTCNEPDMATRHLIPELGFPVKLIPYTQNARKAGKSSYNVFRYFDFALTSLVRTSRVPLRLATIIGSLCALGSFLVGVIYLIYKLTHWHLFSAGIAPLVISVCFLASVQILFIGLIGEYLSVTLDKVTKRPIVVEKERLGFPNTSGEDVL